MKNRLPLLFACLAVLVVAAYFSGAFERNATTIRLPSVSVSEEELESVRIEGGTENIVLRKEGSTWRMVEPFSADVESNAISVLGRSLSELALDRVVSTNPDRYARFGLDSAATTLTVTYGGEERVFVVSDEGPDFQSTYVRVDGDVGVFATRGSLRVDDAVNSWRDKTILGQVADELTRISVEHPDGSYALSRAGGRWRFDNSAGLTADSASVARWLQRYANLRSDGFVDDVAADSVGEVAQRAVRFDRTGGEQLALYVMSHEDHYAVTLGGSHVVFKLLPSRLDTIVPGMAALGN